MRYAIAGALALTAFFVCAVKAEEGKGKMPCAPMADVLAFHAGAGQKIVGRGYLASGATLLVMADKKGEFSLVLISPDGQIACLAAQGERWATVEGGAI